MTASGSRDTSPSSNALSTLRNDGRRQSSAFHGASHAFSQTPVAVKPHSNTYSGTNGALAAASFVVVRGRGQERHPSAGTSAYHHSNVQGAPERPSFNRLPSSCASSTSVSQSPPDQRSSSREQSPSHAAALLAASQATPPSQGPASASRKNPRRPSPLQMTSPRMSNTSPTTVGNASPATKSLVQLYESKQAFQSTTPITHSVRYMSKPAPSIASPIPIRPLPRSRTSASVLPPIQSETWEGKNQAPLKNLPNAARLSALAAAANLAGPPVAANGGRQLYVPTRSGAPEVPAPRRATRRLGLDGSSESSPIVQASRSIPISRRASDAGSNLSLETATSINRLSPQGKPTMKLPRIPARRSASATLTAQPSPSPFSQPPLRPSPDSTRTSPQPPNPRTTNRSTRSSDNRLPQMSVDSLANAIVASSLASSRAPSPTKSVPPLPRRYGHGKPHLFHRNHSQELISRTPSPAKGLMRQTMREPLKSDDEAESGGYKKRNHMVRKHPNKHHEGDRKRYRNIVTERERKRYEGVWAANKGLLIPSSPSTDQSTANNSVLNIIVRDIWSRSRLSDSVLEEVWDLVNSRDDDRLTREEFVVGLWLIDQRLKGNKLPIKVSESVWGSVKRLGGIKVPIRRH